MAIIGLTVGERFWAKVNKDGPVPAHRPELGPCWIFAGEKSRGYGRFYIKGHDRIMAHRFSFEEKNGAIPAGLEPNARHRAKVRAQGQGA